ncbi:sigma 54-interacting transcriptional regulator, partial [Vibrio parahaemolyticus]
KGAFTGANKTHQGVFKQAEGGTLFLDEITEMPIEHQVKLLRVLETGEYRPVGSNTVHIANTRIIAATNRDPKIAIEEQF